MGGTNCTVFSFITWRHPLSPSPGLTLQNTSTGSFTVSSLLICLLGAGVLPVRALMGVLTGARGVLMVPTPVLLGVLDRLGFIFNLK